MTSDTHRAIEEAKRILNRAKQGAVPSTMVPVWVLEELITQADKPTQ